MGQDDDADCAEHVWRLTEVLFAADGSYVTYECERCSAVMAVAPGGTHPHTT